jgi:hypothetical protein
MSTERPLGIECATAKSVAIEAGRGHRSRTTAGIEVDYSLERAIGIAQ